MLILDEPVRKVVIDRTDSYAENFVRTFTVMILCIYSSVVQGQASLEVTDALSNNLEICYLFFKKH